MSGNGGRFAEDVVVVTGAAGQIGAGCVDSFVAEGAQVVALDAMAPPEDSGAALRLTVDLTDDKRIEEAFVTIDRELGVPTIVVQTAAVYGRKPFLEIEGADIDRTLSVNVRAVLLVAKVAANMMVDGGVRGSIVNFTSVSGVVSDGESVGYEASKGAVTMATRGLAVALAPHGIRVNAVGPGNMVKSQEIALVREPDDLDVLERIRIPLAKLGTANQMADAAMFLASDAAEYITGEVIYVDGGALAAWSTYRPEVTGT